MTAFKTGVNRGEHKCSYLPAQLHREKIIDSRSMIVVLWGGIKILVLH